MTKTILLEIGLEEMPARFVANAINELQTRTEKWLTDHRLPFETVSTFSTPRRLTIQVKGVPEKQADVETEAKGPAKKIAVDADGNWTKAALGFARGQGATEDDLYMTEVKGVDYVFVKKFIHGESVMTLLPELKKVILSIPFPKNMKWGDKDIRFVRPIKWIVALFDQEIIPFEIAGVETSNHSKGHRFLGQDVTFTHADEYEEVLLKEHVLADATKRKDAIVSQIKDISETNNWIVPIDEDLLEEVTQLVEYPTALSGNFDESFLQVPDKVLITSMREHQRYFPVKDADGNLLPHFITVRNGDHRHIENVQKGNEKVLRARLADAEFFFKEDKKHTLESRLPKLDTIVYHKELGTIADKVARMGTIVDRLTAVTKADEATIKVAKRATVLSKADLVTHMVSEFPELEGEMGEFYARHSGEDEAVAKAIREHYLPKQSGDNPPQTVAGAFVSVADKVDTLVTSFGIGSIPTGSQDPHGLRRQTAAILTIYLAHNWTFDLLAFLENVIDVADESNLLTRSKEEVKQDLVEFFTLRYKNLLKDLGVRYDVAEAALETKLERPDIVVAKASFLMSVLTEDSFKKDVEAYTRVVNISKKASHDTEVNPSQFETDYEKALYEKTVEVKEKVHASMLQANVADAYKLLKSLVPTINDYFDHTMVMAEDETLRQNRLAQMSELAKTVQAVAAFSHLVFHAE
ncbi:glycine--tRNA ligase subunit beta [Paenalkalicoccus suaedae]|uniref:Glycine--tRNA ligase beta subunit n=1 Tax=Paenalkalicoccus suaedae TaxID=2592382 RepID=A0A859FDD5_9BACI|nr:glycine--tRNA ligase subunit beta [Paenalkalicoccus suaedae]QKS70868.1 glycine--tRNA ligase subunit beta [Paenalkalicoccus suaedae]